MLRRSSTLVMCGYRVDIGGLGDPRPSNVEKARWPRLVGSGRNRPNICLVDSHPVSALSAYSSCYTNQHNGSPITAYRQTACCQGMPLTPQLMVIQAMTNSSAVACLFCWPSFNNPPSSRDSSRSLYHSLSKRSRQPHPAISQAATTTRPSPPYSA